MAYENVNVMELRSSISSCKYAINHSKSDDLSNSLQSNDNWNCDAKKVLINAINKVKNLYTDIETKLQILDKKAENIGKYQALQTDKATQEANWNKLNAELNGIYNSEGICTQWGLKQKLADCESKEYYEDTEYDLDVNGNIQYDKNGCVKVKYVRKQNTEMTKTIAEIKKSIDGYTDGNGYHPSIEEQMKSIQNRINEIETEMLNVDKLIRE